MKNEDVQTKVREALLEAFLKQNRDSPIDTNYKDYEGYVSDYHHTLLPAAFPLPHDFEDRFSMELKCKGGEPPHLHAIHSSAGLAVNCFAPFMKEERISCLTLPIGDDPELSGKFEGVKLEEDCPTGLRGFSPKLDVVLRGPSGIVGVESKFTEYLTLEPKEFVESYNKFKELNTGYSREMERLMQNPKYYKHLDAVQLIKHAYGLSNTFSEQSVTLLNLYWEPKNWEAFCVSKNHREEIKEFSSRIAGSKPAFQAMSYSELWRLWRENPATPDWLQEHIEHLRERYEVNI